MRGRRCATVAGLVALAVMVAAGGAEGAPFSEKPAPVPGEKLFEVAPVDFDGDGRIDLLSSNHSYSSVLLMNLGSWRWADQLSARGLAPNPAFPGWEDVLEGDPPLTSPGAYAFLLRNPLTEPGSRRLVVVGHQRARSVRVRLAPSRRFQVLTTDRAAVTESQAPGGADLIDIDLEAGGRAEIEMSRLELPVEIEDRSAEKRALYIGHLAVPAPGASATLRVRDRHGFAAADVNSDGLLDVFQLVGGIGGRISDPLLTNQIQDRLYWGDGETFRAATPPGLSKGECRGREAASLDINGDSMIDLFMGCEDAPAVAFIARPDGGFSREVIPRSRGTAYRWFQLNRGGPPELAVADDRLRVLTRRGGVWRTIQRAALRNLPEDGRSRRNFNHPRMVNSLTLGDFDRDGDADMFAPSREGNSLLVNQGGRLQVVRPGRLGLPPRSVAAAWVDLRNTGRLDLHLAPQGLFLNRSAGFRKRGWLKRAGKWATISWADFDNDGRRDLIQTSARGRFGILHHVTVSRNRTRSGRWLELDLPPEAEGARVTARLGSRQLTGWVGQSDDAPASQGHSRMYFGFGKSRPGQIEVVVRWPWGGRTRAVTRSHTILRIARP